MLKLVKIIDKKTNLVQEALGYDFEYYKLQGYTKQDVEQSDVNGNWYLAGYAPMKTDEEKAQEEAERIAMLSLTRGDVFRGLLLAKGITKKQIATMIEAMPTSNQEEIVAKELAKIDFEDALNFYRGNSLIDTIGLALGITKEQLDKFFETGDYKELM